jgi:hypothetical protein
LLCARLLLPRLLLLCCPANNFLRLPLLVQLPRQLLHVPGIRHLVSADCLPLQRCQVGS